MCEAFWGTCDKYIRRTTLLKEGMFGIDKYPNMGRIEAGIIDPTIKGYDWVRSMHGHRSARALCTCTCAPLRRLLATVAVPIAWNTECLRSKPHVRPAPLICGWTSSDFRSGLSLKLMITVDQSFCHACMGEGSKENCCCSANCKQ